MVAVEAGVDFWDCERIDRKGGTDIFHIHLIEDINEKLSTEELYGSTKLAMTLGAKFGMAQGAIARNGDCIYALSIHPGTVSLIHANDRRRVD